MTTQPTELEAVTGGGMRGHLQRLTCRKSGQGKCWLLSLASVEATLLRRRLGKVGGAI